jgi:hypothetical protein
MVLHADTVAQNRPARIGARRIDGNDADGTIFLAIVARELVHQRALARARRAGESQDPRMSAMGEERLEQFRSSRGAVFDRADGTGQRTRIAGANLIN